MGAPPLYPNLVNKSYASYRFRNLGLEGGLLSWAIFPPEEFSDRGKTDWYTGTDKCVCAVTACQWPLVKLSCRVICSKSRYVFSDNDLNYSMMFTITKIMLATKTIAIIKTIIMIQILFFYY